MVLRLGIIFYYIFYPNYLLLPKQDFDHLEPSVVRMWRWPMTSALLIVTMMGFFLCVIDVFLTARWCVVCVCVVCARVCARVCVLWCTLLHTISLACGAFLAFWPSSIVTHSQKIRGPGRLVVLTFDPSRVQTGLHSDFCYEHSCVCVCVCVSLVP